MGSILEIFEIAAASEPERERERERERADSRSP
jgi:hypothetical protein